MSDRLKAFLDEHRDELDSKDVCLMIGEAVARALKECLPEILEKLKKESRCVGGSK